MAAATLSACVLRTGLLPATHGTYGRPSCSPGAHLPMRMPNIVMALPRRAVCKLNSLAVDLSEHARCLQEQSCEPIWRRQPR